jgi:hypothetical protein
MRQHSYVIYDLYSSLNIMTVIKSWRVNGAGHVTRMERNGNE